MNDTILILDRDLAAQKALAHWLEQKGHRVLTCHNLETGYQHLSQNFPDLILCDLPATEIRQLAASVQQQQPPLTPIIVISQSEEHTSELQSRENLVCRLLLEK